MVIFNLHKVLAKLAILFLGIIICCFASAQEPVRVKVARLVDVVNYPERSAPATVISLNNTRISAEIQANVDEILVNVGDIVELGQPMIQLDCADYKLLQTESKAQIESLRARIELAKRRLLRTEELLLKQSISEESRDERVSELAVLQADLKASQSKSNSAKLDVGRCRLASPFKALVTERTASVGQFANVGTVLLELVDLEHLEISAQIFNQEVDQLLNAKELHFEHNGSRYPLILRSVVPVINTETRNQEVRLLFKGSQALQGAAGKLIWTDNQAYIAGNLVVNRGDAFGIFYSNAHSAHFYPIAGARTGRSSPIDLPEETLIIIEGHYSLQDSTPVFISE